MWWALFLGCSRPPAAPVACGLAGEVFGTTWTVRYLASPCDEAAVHARIDAALERVDRQMSTWREDSELSRVRAGGRVTVSEDTLEVVKEALLLADATGGAFDPTVQPLMEVWGFHRRGEALATPTAEALAAARAQVGWRRVRLGFDQGQPWVDAGGTALDLSAIAKGFAVDQVAASLRASGLDRFLVEVGGEVRAAGEGPRGAWTLGIEAPLQGMASGSSLVGVVGLRDRALATSGNYRNAVQVEGRRVHHTMDPRTGGPAVSDVLSATVVAPTCAEADGLATAIMVLGARDGLALVEGRPEVEALVLVSTESGWRAERSGGMGALLLQGVSEPKPR